MDSHTQKGLQAIRNLKAIRNFEISFHFQFALTFHSSQQQIIPEEINTSKKKKTAWGNSVI